MKYNKEYKSDEELSKGFRQFKDAILQLSNYTSPDDADFELKLNFFADMEEEEIVNTYLTATVPDLSQLPSRHVKKYGEDDDDDDDILDVDTEPLTNSTSFLEMKNKQVVKPIVAKKAAAPVIFDPIDWVKKGNVSPVVENQGKCGCCWAFGTSAMLESYYSIRYNQTVKSFSKQQLLDCVFSTTFFAGSCTGGNVAFAVFYYYSYDTALATDYPYTEKQGVCKMGGPSLKKKTLFPIIDDYNAYDLVTALQLYNILKKGPVAVNVDASPKEFLYYSQGILKFNCSPVGNHIVLLVGYGIENGVEYWLIKNSWGPQWGESGYVRLLKSNDWDSCNIYKNVVELI